MNEAVSRWRRQGPLVSVKAGHPWWSSHAQLPTVLALSDRLWRVYFAARNGESRGRILAVDVDPTDDMRIVAEHFDPLLDRGPLGAFDHEGVCPSAVIVVDGQVRLYYIGIAVRRDVRMQPTIGLAVSDDGLNFQRAFAGPVLGTGSFDPYFTSAPTVLRGVEGYYMWYVGGTEWRDINGEADAFYDLRVARSTDGLSWDPRTQTALRADVMGAAGIGRPWATEIGAGRRLWFCRRGADYRGPGEGAYRLYSMPIDEGGSLCQPIEPVVFENPPGPEDFDSWMQAYACILPCGRDLVMLYNGNDFGRDGFGWARLSGGASGDEAHR
jgi:hypothetical protein